jgi:predicted RNA binding protein YcfA (HicA-like mRNA interferase family)
MASVAKLVEKMKRQPNGISMEEADKVLQNYGYRLDRQKSSHRQYITDDGKRLSIPYRRPNIKPVYVRTILSAIGE